MTDLKTPEQTDEQEREGWYKRTRYQVLLFAVGIAIFGLVLGVVLDWYINPKTSTQKKDLAQALGLITAGVAGAVGIFFTWRGQRLTQQSLEDARKNTHENLRITREGQITDRFTRAIDQLGKVEGGQKLFEVRIGGIYALERIARESEEDYWPIMQILTAYVRKNALRLPPRLAEAAQERTKDATHEQHATEGSGGKSGTTEPTPDPDIEAIMYILRRRKHAYMRGEPERLDLERTILSGAILSEADLSGADLRAADFSVANLYGADLSGAYVSWALFLGALLSEADLSEAHLSEADLSGAILYGADLSGANLSGADLSGANVTQEQLEETTGDVNIELPPDLIPPAHWGAETDKQAEEG